ncbi:MAG: serine aminopeptidase domain-containing protein [Bacteroidota bacterium]
MFLVLITPVFTVNSFLYPIRIDSAMVAQQLLPINDSTLKPQPLHPGQLRLAYETVYFRRENQPGLRGWISYDTSRKTAPLIIIVPDIDEGKISYLIDMAEWNARGFHACVIDMRGQGASEGPFYDPGKNSAMDLVGLTNKLGELERVEYVACMGVGTGAGICMMATADTSFKAQALVLQNPPISLEKQLQRAALKGWGGLLYPLLPVLKRSYERTTGNDFHQHSYGHIMSGCHIPYLIVGAGKVSEAEATDINALLKASGNSKKKTFWELQEHDNKPFHNFSKKYYDHLSGFVVLSRQSPVYKTRKKKLVFE